MSQRGIRLKQEDAPAVGIDLGTTYSVVAVYRGNGRIDVIANDIGDRTTPSVVAFRGDERFVGEAAKDLPAVSRVFDAKRMLGRSFNDAELQKDMKRWPFTVVDFKGTPRIQIVVNNKKEAFAPEEVSAAVLANLKETAEAYLEATVTKAVITVPAYFNERQRQATKDAGKIAGLEVIGMINEPTAAAIAYGLDKFSSKRTVLIYDLGGGTFDVSILTICKEKFTVLAHCGDTHLGGQDFDVRIMDHFMKDIYRRHGIQVDKDPESLQELRTVCEMSKRRLTKLPEVPISIFFSRFSVCYKNTLSRALFNDLCADLFAKTIEISRKVIEDSKITMNAIDDVVLVGGSTRILKVQEMLKALFKGKQLKHSVNPDEAVAQGAAVHAAALQGKRHAANQVVLKDVTPLSLGCNTHGGIFSVVIPRNTPIPCERMKTFTNGHPYITNIGTSIYQGERSMTKDNHSLDKTIVISIPPKPVHENVIDITFTIDVNGLLSVRCVDRTTGKGREVTINRTEAALDQREIDRMVKSALRFKDEDGRKLKEAYEQLRRMKLYA